MKRFTYCFFCFYISQIMFCFFQNSISFYTIQLFNTIKWFTQLFDGYLLIVKLYFIFYYSHRLKIINSKLVNGGDYLKENFFASNANKWSENIMNRTEAFFDAVIVIAMNMIVLEINIWLYSI